MCFITVGIVDLPGSTITCRFRPVTGGADQDEEEDVDCECVKDGYDGAFRDGHARSLQLAFRDMWRQSKHISVCSFVYIPLWSTEPLCV